MSSYEIPMQEKLKRQYKYNSKSEFRKPKQLWEWIERTLHVTSRNHCIRSVEQTQLTGGHGGGIVARGSSYNF